MVKLTAMTKDVKIPKADYVIEDTEKLKTLLQYLTPKIFGDWYIAVLEPKLVDVRLFLDTEMIPDYLTVELFVETGLLETLMLERPKLAVKTKTNWEKYCDLIAASSKLYDERAMSEIYRRVGTNTSALAEALEVLESKVKGDTITTKDVRLYIQDNHRVYARQVVAAFLEGNKNCWELFYSFEKELGDRIAFYALRKYLRKLLLEKNEFLLNHEYKDRTVEKVDAISIIKLLELFEQATSYKQLVPILVTFMQRRKQIC